MIRMTMMYNLAVSCLVSIVIIICVYPSSYYSYQSNRNNNVLQQLRRNSNNNNNSNNRSLSKQQRISFILCNNSCRRNQFDNASFRNKLTISNSNRLSIRNNLLILYAKQSKDDDDDDDIFSNKPGMEAAFKELDLLKSLDDDNDKNKLNTDSNNILSNNSKRRPIIELDESMEDMIIAIESPSIEKEIEIYKDMMSEVEKNDNAETYNELILDLGSKSLISTDSTYADMILELGGTPKLDSSIPMTTKEKKPITTTAFEKSGSDTKLLSNNLDSDEIINKALNDAMKEVTLNNPQISSSTLLNDKELMKEIEAILNEGNDKLIQSLNDIRKEQEALAKEDATKNAQQNLNDMMSGTNRLHNAEQSMTGMLQKVNIETKNVESAIQELQNANEQINNSFLYKLKKGGIIKQVSFIGLILFSLRSIFDTINAVSNNDETYLMTGLVQGVTAIICAAIFFLIK